MPVQTRVQHVQEVFRVPQVLIRMRGNAPGVPVVRVRGEGAASVDEEKGQSRYERS